IGLAVLDLRATVLADCAVLLSAGINDGEMKTLYMNATGAGKWQVMCHVHMHQTMGMVSNYQVHFAGQCPLPALGSQATIR
ncbi:hypothetical protein LTR60_004106, partial [Cryomyces antarcticus]